MTFMEYKLLIDGQWLGGGSMLEVRNKYNGELVGVVPAARKEDLDAAIDAAERAEDVIADMPAYKRAEILLKAAALLRERADNLAKTIAAEAGKAMKLARADHMPYGGNRQSGLGREGVKFAMEDMTNIQMVAIRLT